MNGSVKRLRCAIYTRKSSEHNLDLAFTSLDAQREACEAYIKSQAHEGWRLIFGRYDDGGKQEGWKCHQGSADGERVQGSAEERGDNEDDGSHEMRYVCGLQCAGS